MSWGTGTASGWGVPRLIRQPPGTTFPADVLSEPGIAGRYPLGNKKKDGRQEGSGAEIGLVWPSRDFTALQGMRSREALPCL